MAVVHTTWWNWERHTKEPFEKWGRVKTRPGSPRLCRVEVGWDIYWISRGVEKYEPIRALGTCSTGERGEDFFHLYFFFSLPSSLYLFIWNGGRAFRSAPSGLVHARGPCMLGLCLKRDTLSFPVGREQLSRTGVSESEWRNKRKIAKPLDESCWKTIIFCTFSFQIFSVFFLRADTSKTTKFWEKLKNRDIPLYKPKCRPVHRTVSRLSWRAIIRWKTNEPCKWRWNYPCSVSATTWSITTWITPHRPIITTTPWITLIRFIMPTRWDSWPKRVKTWPSAYQSRAQNTLLKSSEDKVFFFVSNLIS